MEKVSLIGSKLTITWYEVWVTMSTSLIQKSRVCLGKLVERLTAKLTNETVDLKMIKNIKALNKEKNIDVLPRTLSLVKDKLQVLQLVVQKLQQI